MSYFVSFARFFIYLILLILAGLGIVGSSFYLHLAPSLPSVSQIRDSALQVPLRIYTSDKKLLAEFGEKRRTPVNFDDVPEKLIKAFLAAEDKSFYQHNGVYLKGLARALVELAQTGEIQSGGSTITMQVARNFFLSREKTFSRKFKEILLSLQIEQELAKDEILELYFNKIYLGNRAYGIAAAAEVYYGKKIEELTLAEIAMIAGLPKAPSTDNPISAPKESLERRNWILGRMLALNFITQAEHDEAAQQPVTATYHELASEVDAPYLAEMTRQWMVQQFGEGAYETGYTVELTVDSNMQRYANNALHKGLQDYTKRHGYLGPIRKLTAEELQNEQILENVLSQTPVVNTLEPAIVVDTSKTRVLVRLAQQETGEIGFNDLKWAKKALGDERYGAAPKTASDVVETGDLIYAERLAPVAEAEEEADNAKPVGDGDKSEEAVSKSEDSAETKPVKLRLAQLPKVQGALVSMRADDGALQAVVGGYSFSQSKYNRALQAKRQAGSNLKPFIYMAALEHGRTAASLINDAPIVQSDEQMAQDWRPRNSGGEFLGPITLRQALYQSRNLVSIRLLRSTGINNTRRFLTRLGFAEENLTPTLSLALGAAEFTPMEMARAYAIIANGGRSVTPYFIAKVSDSEGNVVVRKQKPVSETPCVVQENEVTEITNENLVEQAVYSYTLDDVNEVKQPDETICEASKDRRVVDARIVFIMQSILRDVVKRGTGRRALALNRSDLAGKTGTTNEQKDAWFSGFSGGIVTSVWVGFDQPKTLGRREFGAIAALPIWIDYMKKATDGKPLAKMKRPSGLVTARIDKQTGLRTQQAGAGSEFEIFRRELLPEMESAQERITHTERKTDYLPEEIF